MANGYNQYIGMRYVPIVDGAWSSSKAYEPLVVVTYNGNSYISKTFAPAGTLPTNEEYWILSANYNAQVEQYRQEVRQYQQTVDGYDDRITQAESAVDGFDERLTTAESNVENLETDIITLTDDIIMVHLVTGSFTTNANGTSSYSYDVTRQGYEPIAIGSVYELGTSVLEVTRWGFSGNNAVFNFRNPTTSNIQTTMAINVIYKKIK